MNHVLRKMTAFASALVMLGGSIVYGQFGGVFSTARISAEEAESEYSVDLERSYNMIVLDGKYYAFNIARSISKKDFSVNDDDIFIESLQRGEQIQAKEIAGKCGVLEASTSRTWKTFKDKVIAGNSRRK